MLKTLNPRAETKTTSEQSRLKYPESNISEDAIIKEIL